MIELVINCTGNMEKMVAHIFDIFFSIMGIPYVNKSEENINVSKHNLVINYGSPILSQNLKNYVTSGGFLINIANRNETDWKSLVSIDIRRIRKVIIEVINSGDINQIIDFHDDIHPIIFTLDKQGNGLLINLGMDIISSAFYILFKKHNMLQENPFIEDNFKEKSGSGSYFIINEYITLLNEIIVLCFVKRGIPFIQKMPWPGGRKYAVCLAHDVDWFDTWKLSLYEIVIQAIKTKNLFLGCRLRDAISDFLNVVLMVLKRETMYKDIEKALRIEDNFGFQSSFYVYGNKKPMNPPFSDKTYSTLENARFINSLLERGREIGLHGSYWSYLSGRMLSYEKRILEEIIGKEVMGLRQHCQNFDPAITWRVQERSGFEYDVTRMDTRVCFPFKVFNVSNNEGRWLTEIPLTIMDEPLTDFADALVLSDRRIKFIEAVKTIIDEVRRYNGVSVILWHPFEKYSGCLSAYHEVLRHLKNTDAYITTCENLADWWIRRDSMKVIDIKYGHNYVEWRIHAEKDVENVFLKFLNINGDVSVIGIHNYEVMKEDGIIYVKVIKVNADEGFSIRCDTGEKP